MLHIQVLYTDGCSHYATALDQIRALSQQVNILTKIEIICIKTIEQAQMHHFLGSPSIRFNGKDIEPLAADVKAFGLT